ncbi:MAG: peptidylprolyl isomerase [Dysgonomonas sp.]
MKKNLLLFCVGSLLCGSISAQTQDPVLMKINGKPVPKSEFEYLYHKNNTSAQQSLDEYLKLFTDYKLKVEEALNQGFDTVPSFKAEYTGYKNQITLPLLQDTLSEQTVAKKEYDRLGENIEVSHILLRFPQMMLLPKDTLAAYEKAVAVRNKLIGNKAKAFDVVAAEDSEDPSAKMFSPAGYLGWTSALMFVAPFEDAMYATKVNEVSMPVRSPFGYHLIKVHNKRPDIGKVNVSHIMFAFPQRDPSPQMVDSIKKVAEEVYAKLLAGGSYDELCKEYSTDKQSAKNNGVLGWLEIGVRLPKEFMDASYGIKNVGDITAPVKTDFGYHIIKLNDRAARDSWNDSKYQIVNRVKNSDFADDITLLQIENLAKKENYTLNKATYDQLISLSGEYLPTDSVFLKKLSDSKETLLTIGKKSYTLSDFSKYIETQPNFKYNISTDYINGTLNNFILTEMQEEYIASLPERNPEYKNLLKEYHDGILLFNIMNAEVWEKAANDTVGLTNYFDKNKKKYTWDSPRYKGYIVYCKDEDTFKSAQKLANKNKKSDDLTKVLNAAFNNDSVSFVVARRGVWGKGDNKFVDAYVYKSGVQPEPVKDYPFYFVVGKKISKPEEYSDVRGLVTSDYQEAREKEWMDMLRKKYTVEVDQTVLETIK